MLSVLTPILEKTRKNLEKIYFNQCLMKIIFVQFDLEIMLSWEKSNLIFAKYFL